MDRFREETCICCLVSIFSIMNDIWSNTTGNDKYAKNSKDMNEDRKVLA